MGQRECLWGITQTRVSFNGMYLTYYFGFKNGADLVLLVVSTSSLEYYYGCKNVKVLGWFLVVDVDAW